MSSLVGFCQRFVGWGLCARKLQSAGVMADARRACMVRYVDLVPRW